MNLKKVSLRLVMLGEEQLCYTLKMKDILNIIILSSRDFILYVGDRMKTKESNQLKYAQQHLANERTYLAWIRTVISIVGVGFLATSLHFTVGVHRNTVVDVISILLGFFVCILGIAIIFLATISYRRKKHQISEETFTPSNMIVVSVSLLTLTVILIVILYFLLLTA